MNPCRPTRVLGFQGLLDVESRVTPGVKQTTAGPLVLSRAMFSGSRFAGYAEPARRYDAYPWSRDREGNYSARTNWRLAESCLVLPIN